MLLLLLLLLWLWLWLWLLMVVWLLRGAAHPDRPTPSPLSWPVAFVTGGPAASHQSFAIGPHVRRETSRDLASGR